jgi:carbonic anhydrase
MENFDYPSRRQFVGRVALATGVAGLGIKDCLSTAWAVARPERPTPEAVLEKLLEGNKRFVEGKLVHPRRAPNDFMSLSEGQAPIAAIIGCADSRVAPELVFDQGIGDLFVVRVAGNIVSGAGATVKGSLEYAVAELGVRLIVVLGHSGCGACKAAMKHIEAGDRLPGAIDDLINPIRPLVQKAAAQPGDKLANLIKANVQEGVKRLKGLEPILSKLVQSGEMNIVGGIYELRTGKVEFNQ